MRSSAVHGESMVEQLCPCGTWRSTRESPAATGGPSVRAGGCPKEGVIPWKFCTGAGSWQNLWTYGERRPCWRMFAVRNCGAVGDPCWRILFLMDCSLRWGIRTGEVSEEKPWEVLILENCVSSGRNSMWNKGRV